MEKFPTIIRELRRIGVDMKGRRALVKNPEILAEMLSISENMQKICMETIEPGNNAIRAFHEQIIEKDFHHTSDLFNALESFFYLHYNGVSLHIYVIHEKGDKVIDGNIQNIQNWKNRLREQNPKVEENEDLRIERCAWESRQFEENGGKGSICIELPGKKLAILSFGDIQADPITIKMIRQGFKQGGFDKIIRLKLHTLHRTYKDALTGLYNRAYFNQVVSSKSYSLINIDINHFKIINDTFGHHVGDIILQEIATILMESIYREDKACRVGGDEFILLIHTAETGILEQIMTRIRSKIQKNKLIQTFNNQIEKKLGVAIGYHTHVDNVPLAERLEIADRKMYQDKARSECQKMTAKKIIMLPLRAIKFLFQNATKM